MCNDCDDFFVKKTVQHAKELRIKVVLIANKIEITTHDKIPKNA